ncbi:uncharacterized protein LOC128226585 [Mya arenaria]|uniref:uncharacterized protein LOC128226585 n=1 Tax=Mya arenaria TaxID=6604 RepID=UPI0022E6A3BB|nr:uncharacterized protein LOC128226585 [Mya arenaria]
MATGHILPGYGNPVTRLKRAQTAYPLDKTKLREIAERNVGTLEKRDLESIRQNARNMWLAPNYEPTTYNSVHHHLTLDEPTASRPSSPSRRHKPHPKPVFLINRLHYVPGYHNPDTTVGRDPYIVDDSYPEEERQLRRHQREKFIARPRTAAVNQYNEPYAPLTESVGPVEAWGAQAWLKTADDNYQHEVVNAIQDYRDQELFNVSKSPVPALPQAMDATPRPYTAIPSMTRWMKQAGVREAQDVRKILYGGYPPSTIQPLGSLGTPPTLSQRRQQVMDNVRKARYVHKPTRGDFLIHPEWPPSFPHHKID